MAIPTNDVDEFFSERDEHPYARYLDEQDQQDEREREAVRAAKSAGMVRCLSADEFFAPESTANLVVPALGICPGPPTGIVGQAYVGKTLMGLSAGLSVALGKDLWGNWRVQEGPWLHLDYEQGKRHTKARIHRLARGFGIADDHLRALLVAGVIRVAVFPDLRLTTDQAADHFRRVFEGVRLVTCDSLRMMIAGVDENSSQVRGLMGALSAASDKSGAAVSLIHHGGKTPLEGERSRKEVARGSSGIVDEFQSLFVMTKKKGETTALVTHEKDRELGETLPDFGLRIDDVSNEMDPKWGLRVVHVDREEMKAPSGKAKLDRAVDAVRGCIASNPGVAGTDAVRALLGLDALVVRAAVNTLLADGLVVERRNGRGRRFYLSHMAPPEGS